MPVPAFDEIVETFEFLDDWEDRYRYVIDLGKAMDALDDAFKVPAYKVDGCASQVWLVPQVEGSGADAVVRFQGDSDAMIVRGLIAILTARLSGRAASQFDGARVLADFAGLGLDKHLSAQRSNGLRAMIARLEQVGRGAAA